MLDPFALFTGLGGIISFIFAMLVILIPVSIYLTQRNTYQSRIELKRTNDLLEKILETISDQGHADKEITDVITMTCPNCKKVFKYGRNHSGKIKPCPGCGLKITLE